MRGQSAGRKEIAADDGPTAPRVGVSVEQKAGKLWLIAASSLALRS